MPQLLGQVTALRPDRFGGQVLALRPLQGAPLALASSASPSPAAGTPVVSGTIPNCISPRAGPTKSLFKY